MSSDEKNDFSYLLSERAPTELKTGDFKIIKRPTKDSQVFFIGDFVVKVWLSELEKYTNDYKEQSSFSQFAYEKKIYEHLKNNLKFEYIRPFIRYIGGDDNASISKILEESGKVTSDGRVIPDVFNRKIIKKVLSEFQISFNRYNKYVYVDGYKKLSQIAKRNIIYDMYEQNVKLSYIVTENNNLTTVYNYFVKIRIHECDKKIPLCTSLWVIIMIVRACNWMHRVKVTHNDLHFDNIFTLFIKGVPFPMIYDYDRAYCPEIGKNFMLEGDICKKQGECNIYSEDYNPDIYHVIYNYITHIFYGCNMYEYKERNKIVKRLAKYINTSGDKSIDDVYEHTLENITAHYDRFLVKIDEIGTKSYIHIKDEEGVLLKRGDLKKDGGILLENFKILCDNMMNDYILRDIVENIKSDMYKEYLATQENPLEEEDYYDLLDDIWDASTIIEE